MEKKGEIFADAEKVAKELMDGHKRPFFNPLTGKEAKGHLFWSDIERECKLNSVYDLEFSFKVID